MNTLALAIAICLAIRTIATLCLAKQNLIYGHNYVSSKCGSLWHQIHQQTKLSIYNMGMDSTLRPVYIYRTHLITPKAGIAKRLAHQERSMGVLSCTRYS